MTLTHWDTVDWADAATDRAEHDGLTELGERCIRELNRVGMFVDLSHVSPDTMKDALRVTRAPLLSRDPARDGPKPSGVARGGDEGSNATGSNLTLAMADEVRATPGATGLRAATATFTDTSVAQVIALKPSSGPQGTPRDR